jgi:hypothetical protein
MYHDLPRSASFWSFLLAVDEDLAAARPSGISSTTASGKSSLASSGGCSPGAYGRTTVGRPAMTPINAFSDPAGKRPIPAGASLSPKIRPWHLDRLAIVYVRQRP